MKILLLIVWLVLCPSVSQANTGPPHAPDEATSPSTTVSESPTVEKSLGTSVPVAKTTKPSFTPLRHITIDQPVRIGVLARRGKPECLRAWTPTAHYLERRVHGVRFEIVPLQFEEVEPAVQRETVDFLVVNSAIYVEMQELYGVNRLATMKTELDGVETMVIGGVVFARADRNDILDFKDLRDKSFVGVDEASFSGWLAVLRELKNAGLDPARDFTSLTFAGTHDKVVMAVKEGRADAGSVSASILEQMELEGKIALSDFRIINERKGDGLPFRHSTRVYPDWPFSKLRHTPQDLSERVCIALLLMPPNSPAASAAKIAGWTVPMGYLSVGECLKELRVGIYKNLGKVRFSDVLTQYRWWLASVAFSLLALGGFQFYVLRLNTRLRSSGKALEKAMEERFQAEEAFGRLAHRHELILGSAGEAIIGLDTTGRVVFMNPAAEETTGWKTSELIGNFHHERIHHTKADGTPYLRSECPILTAIDEGRRHRESNEIFWKKEGSSFPVEYLCTPMLENGEIVGAVLTFSDITARKHAEAELKRLLAERGVILDNIPVGVAFVKKREFIWINEEMTRIYEYSAEEFSGMSTRVLYVSEDDFETEGRKGYATLARGETYFTEVLLQRKNGEPVWSQLVGCGVPGNGGIDAGGAIWIFQDITARKRSEAELKRVLTERSVLLDNVPVGISFLKNREFLWINREMMRIFGQTIEELQNTSTRMHYEHEEDFERVGREAYATVTRGEIYSTEVLMRRKNGELFWCHVTGCGIPDADGIGADGSIWILQDITDRKRSEKELQTAMLMAEAANRAKSEFLANMSHELRTPLHGVIGFGELLVQETVGPLNDAQKEFAVDILESGKRLLVLVNDLLDLAKIEAGRMELQPTEFSPSDLFRRSMSIIGEEALKKQIALRMEIGDMSEVISGDESKLRRVLLNLLTNAVKFTPEGGEIVLSARWATARSSGLPVADSGERSVEISVADNGIGIDACDLQRIFQPFEQGDGSFSRQYEGTGLGLHLSRKLIELHHGKIWAESDGKGKGSVFRFVIPTDLTEYTRES